MFFTIYINNYSENFRCHCTLNILDNTLPHTLCTFCNQDILQPPVFAEFQSKQQASCYFGVVLSPCRTVLKKPVKVREQHV